MNRCLSIPIPCSEKTESLTVDKTSSFSFQIFKSSKDINDSVWEGVAKPDHLFFNLSYLEGLEDSVDENVEFRYLLISNNQQPVGAVVFQLVKFRGANVENEPGEEIGLIEKILRSLMVKAIHPISLNLLVCGNTFVTGKYGVHLTGMENPDGEMASVLQEGIQEVINAEKPVRKISGVLIKDFYPEEKVGYEELIQSGYLEFKVNPNMVLELVPEWKTFDDYLGAMSSKYRTRMRKALKRSKDIKVVDMDEATLEKDFSKIIYLYNQVMDNTAFKLTKLNVEYLLKLKRSLKDKFKIIGYYKDDELASFITYYLDKDELVAGFMGMNYRLNKEYDLYLNILLKLAGEGIKAKVKKVTYGRTAMEIKSSIGAVPKEMYLYTKHRSAIVNKIIHFIVKLLSKEEEWTLRSPFKKDGSK